MTNKAITKTDGKRAREKSTADAIALLEADHREVEALFASYDAAGADAERKAIADSICLALKVHAQIEEELFYPAARDATGDTDLLDEATVEHQGAKTLVAQIEASAPGRPLYDAQIRVLEEQVRHHVGEEEGELFPQARESGLDLAALGARLAARKTELLAPLAPAP